jgi:hypothetical protein
MIGIKGIVNWEEIRSMLKLRSSRNLELPIHNPREQIL